MKSMVQNVWSYYFYDSPQDFFEDIGLVPPPLAGIESKDVPELIDLIRQNSMPAKIRRSLIEYFDLKKIADGMDILNAFFNNYVFEMKTIHDVVWNRKRKLTRREIRKYSKWAGLDELAHEDAVRQDIIRRWENSWFAQVIPMLEKEGFVIGTSCFSTLDIFGIAFKGETGIFTIDCDWLNENIKIRLTYRNVSVLVSRGCDENGEYYSKTGNLLTDKWDVRYAPEEFERPLMEEAGYKLSDGHYEGEYWFRYDTTNPSQAVKAIKSLKQVGTKIEKHFNAIYKSVDLLYEAQDIMKESPQRALKLAEKALKFNPCSKVAKRLIKKLM